MINKINITLTITSIIIFMLAMLMYLYTQDINSGEYMFEIPNPDAERTNLYNSISKGTMLLLGTTWFVFYCRAIVKGKL